MRNEIANFRNLWYNSFEVINVANKKMKILNIINFLSKDLKILYLCVLIVFQKMKTLRGVRNAGNRLKWLPMKKI